jgi:hypothetical protein
VSSNFFFRLLVICIYTQDFIKVVHAAETSVTTCRATVEKADDPTFPNTLGFPAIPGQMGPLKVAFSNHYEYSTLDFMFDRPLAGVTTFYITGFQDEHPVHVVESGKILLVERLSNYGHGFERDGILNFDNDTKTGKFTSAMPSDVYFCKANQGCDYFCREKDCATIYSLACDQEIHFRH